MQANSHKIISNNHTLVTFLIIFCGLCISFSLFFLLKHWEEQNRYDEFRYKASDHAAAIQTELEHIAKNVADVRFLIEHDLNIEHDNALDPNDFMPMAEQLIINDPHLKTITWSINNASNQQPDWQTIYHKHTEHAHQEKNNKHHYTQHILKALANKNDILLHTFIELTEHGNLLSFVAIVHHPQQLKSTHNSMQQGALIVQFELAGLIDRSLEKLPVSSQDISFFLLRNHMKSQLVYKHLSRSRSPDERNIHTGIEHTVAFQFADLSWQLEFEAAPNFLVNHPIILAWLSLSFCLFLTAFFVWFVYFTHRQTQIIEQVVIERTAELGQSEQRLRLAMEGTSGGLWDLNIQTDEMYFSPSWEHMLGYATGTIEPHLLSWKNMIHPNDRTVVIAQLQQHLAHQTERYEAEYRMRTEDNTWLWVLDRGKVLEWAKDGTALRAVGTYTDIHERRLAEEKLQHLDRVESLGVLAGGIAHDFNNLLTAILGNASLAHIKLAEDSPAISHLDAIEKASCSAADLCKQMLAYSGKGKFVIKAICLSSMVSNMAKLISISIPKNIVLKYQLNQKLPSIEADVAQMQQIVLNLLTNATEAIEQHNGSITLGTGIMRADQNYLEYCLGNKHLQAGLYIYLEVSDTGCGMDKATQTKIFDPFFTTKFTGRGLGMSAMLGIVKGHHGGLRIYSEVGHGTTIKIIFPVTNNTLLPNEPTEKTGKNWRASGTVLIVDDEETVRDTAQAMLEHFGFRVLTANDGVHGLDVFRRHQTNITLVLLDMTMPNMDGEACFRELRHIQEDVCVILSSGYNEQDAINRFTGEGLAGFIQKPYTQHTLAEQLKTILS